MRQKLEIFWVKFLVRFLVRLLVVASGLSMALAYGAPILANGANNSANSANSANGADGARDLQKLLGNLSSMHASFHEVSSAMNANKANKINKFIDGEVWIQKPGKFYWQNAAPNNELFLSNGEDLWHYQPDLLQATKSPLSGALDQTPLLLLSGKVTHISDLFTVEELNSAEFLLTPKASANLILSMTLKFNAGKISSFSLESSLGQTTVITFSNVDWDVPIPASKFEFVRPQGVDLFEA